MTKLARSSLLLSLSLVAAACGDDGAMPMDAASGELDGGRLDAAPPGDGGEVLDAGALDASAVDASALDAGEDDAGFAVCTPGATESCYDGPAGTEGVGVCTGGTRTCLGDGSGFGDCEGDVVPTVETCDTALDDDCDGMVNEEGASCACTPGSSASCYSGPAGTAGSGICTSGTQLCNAEGTAYGPCVDEVLPAAETCNTPVDDDCDGQINEEGAGCVCTPSAMVSCYTGPAGTAGVGACRAGMATCDASGTALGPCVGEVLPGTETCNTPADDDCDGQTNEEGAGCVCIPGSTASCYSGPAGTQGVGLCRAGTRTCNALGTAYGACTGEIVPAASESCATAGDDDCDGMTNEGCPAVSYATHVQPILQAHCGPCHVSFSSGGANLAASYAATQLASYYCAGQTKGACMLVRIQNGSMPQGAGCTGNPVTDAGNPACLTAAEQATIQAWITGGQLP